MKTRKNNLVELEEFIDKEYGKHGTERRDKFEEDYEAFKLGVMLQEMRKQKNMTQARNNLLKNAVQPKTTFQELKIMQVT